MSKSLQKINEHLNSKKRNWVIHITLEAILFHLHNKHFIASFYLIETPKKFTKVIYEVKKIENFE